MLTNINPNMDINQSINNAKSTFVLTILARRHTHPKTYRLAFSAYELAGLTIQWDLESIATITENSTWQLPATLI